MVRKKLDLVYIANPSKRRITFKKRKNGLIKKIDELSVLCGIEACAVICTPEDPQPEVWPSNFGVERVFSRFRGMSELEQDRKRLNQESLLQKSIVKGQEQLKKMRGEHRKIEISLHIAQYFFNALNFFDNVHMFDLNDVTHLINQNLKEVTEKINMKRAQEVTSILENGGESMPQGEQEVVNHVQEPENNVDAMQNLNGSMDNINGDGGPETLPVEDVDVHSGWLNSFIL